jgi:hypothetical protein
MSKYWRGLTIIASLLVLQAVMQTACESATDSDSEFVVLSVSPEDGADSIPLQPTIRIAFSNWIDSDRLSSLHIDIEGSSHDSLTVSRSSDGGVRRGYLIIRPTQRLPGDSVLSVTLKAGLRDVDGNVLQNDYRWSFRTTVGTISVLQLEPEPGATDASLWVAPRAYFSKALDSSTFDPSLVSMSGCPDAAAFIVHNGDGTGSIVVHPGKRLDYNTVYEVAISPGVFSTDGDWLSSEVRWSFITGGPFWTEQQSNTTVNLNAVDWTGSRFVAVGGQATILVSDNGIDWTIAHTDPNVDELIAVAHRGDSVITVTPDSYVFYSPNYVSWRASYLISWDPEIPFGPPVYTGMAWGDSGLIAVTNAGAYRMAYWSSGFPCWWYYDYPTNFIQGIEYVAGKYWARFRNGDQIGSSSDGLLNWQRYTVPTSATVLGLTTDGSKTVVSGVSGLILITRDFVDWHDVSVPVTSDLQAPIITEDQCIIVGDSGATVRTLDYAHWQSIPPTTSRKLRDVAWSGTIFVAVGDSGTILTSQ